MNMVTRILPNLLLVATALVFFSCQQGGESAGAASGATAAAAAATGPSIVYVRLDSLQAGYGVLATELERLQENVQKADQNIQAKMTALQKEAQRMQNRVQQGLMTPKNIQAEQQRLGRQEQEIMQQRDLALASIQEDQMRVQQQFGERLKAILEDLQETKGYDYIFSEGGASGLLMGKDAFDITNEVLERLNATEEPMMAKDSVQ